MTGLMWSHPGQTITGNELYVDCIDTENFDRKSLCLGYVTAIVDVLSSSLCVPPGATQGQAVDIVTKALKEHPKNRNQRAAILAGAALKLDWPCPKKKP